MYTMRKTLKNTKKYLFGTAATLLGYKNRTDSDRQEDLWKEQLANVESELTDASKESEDNEEVVIRAIEYVIMKNEEGLKMLADEEMAERERQNWSTISDHRDSEELEFKVDKIKL